MAFDPRALGAQAMSDNKAYKARTGYSPFAPRPPTMPAPQQNLAPTQAQPQQWNGQNMTGPNALPTTANPQMTSLFRAAQAGAVPMTTTMGASGTPGSLNSGLGAMYSQAKQAAADRFGAGMGGTAQFGQGFPGGSPTGSLKGPAMGGLPAGSYGQAMPQAPTAPNTTPQVAPPSSLPRPAWIDTFLRSDQARDRNLAINWVQQNKTGQAPNFVQPAGRDFWDYQRRNSGR